MAEPPEMPTRPLPGEGTAEPVPRVPPKPDPDASSRARATQASPGVLSPEARSPAPPAPPADTAAPEDPEAVVAERRLDGLLSEQWAVASDMARLISEARANLARNRDDPTSCSRW